MQDTSIRYNRIYRKQTTTKLSINYNSFHPTDHKLANFRFLLNRLNNIPLSKNNYKKEFWNIINIAQYKNFPISDIHKLIIKIKAKNFKIYHTTLNNNEKQTKN